MTYEFGEAVPDPLVQAVEPGTNVLVSGPAMSGKAALMRAIVAEGARRDEGSVVVTANDGAATIYDRYHDALTEDAYLRIIDAVGNENPDLGAFVRSCGSPGDLTGMGIEFSEIAKEADREGIDRMRVAFDSLTPVLMYVDLERLFRFLHVFTRQIQSKDWLGLFAIDPESHDAQTINTINQLFDGVVQIRLPEEGGREIRTRGFGQRPSEWVDYD
jgi:KaiC/GvpD/RAD55 family RecA-like ATPase